MFFEEILVLHFYYIMCWTKLNLALFMFELFGRWILLRKGTFGYEIPGYMDPHISRDPLILCLVMFVSTLLFCQVATSILPFASTNPQNCGYATTMGKGRTREPTALWICGSIDVVDSIGF